MFLHCSNSHLLCFLSLSLSVLSESESIKPRIKLNVLTAGEHLLQ